MNPLSELTDSWQHTSPFPAARAQRTTERRERRVKDARLRARRFLIEALAKARRGEP